MYPPLQISIDFDNLSSKLSVANIAINSLLYIMPLCNEECKKSTR